jgi:hypothetical protein
VLLWAAALFAGTQIAAGIVFDYVWPQIRYPWFYKQVARYESLPRSPYVLVLGSSRSGCLFDESAVNQVVCDVSGDDAFVCFNAWTYAGDPVVYERLFNALLDKGPPPRYALIEVNPEGICRRNCWLEYYYCWLLRWDDTPAFLTDLVVTRNFLKFTRSRLVPLYFYRDEIRREVGEWACDWYEQRPGKTAAKTTEHRVARGTPRDGAKWQQAIVDSVRKSTVDPTRSTTGNLMYVERWFRNYQVGGNLASALDRVIAQCRAHNIEPILFTPPLSGAHRQYYTPEIESAFQGYVGELTQRYACRHLDYRTSLPDAFFIDHHHAGPDGGALFTRRFSLEVLVPLWLGHVRADPGNQ